MSESIVSMTPQDGHEPMHEKVGMGIAIVSIVIPGMLVSGFMPDWNVLPFVVWLAIAGIGGAIGSAIYTKRIFIGAVTGLLIGVGGLLGTYYYVAMRHFIIDSNTYWNIELAIGGLIGAIPGFVFYHLCTKLSEDKEGAWVLSEED